MITLVTGVPGAGKTLYAVSQILDNLKSDNPRPIFANINGLDYDSLKCFPLSEAQIYDLRQFSGMSAIVIIDECQRFYPPRSSGSKVPEYISYFNVHRHDGIDIILITQGPKLIDKQIRDVIGRHVHFTRPFSMGKNFMYEWTGCNDDPEPSKSESNAVRTSKSLNKDIFKYYKSTVENTHSSRFPRKKVIMFVFFIVLALTLIFYTFFSLLHKYDSPSDNPVKSDSLSDAPSSAPAAATVADMQVIGNNTSASFKPINFNQQSSLSSSSFVTSNNSDSSQILDSKDINKQDEINNIIRIVGFVSGSTRIPVLSRGYKINDFTSYYYEPYDQRFYLCYSSPCSGQRYDFELKTGKYLIDMQNYLRESKAFARR